MDRTIITAKEIQYSSVVYTPLTPLSSVEKYAVIRLTGKNKIVTLAKRMVILVNFSTACVSLRAIRLKFCVYQSTFILPWGGRQQEDNYQKRKRLFLR